MKERDLRGLRRAASVVRRGTVRSPDLRVCRVSCAVRRASGAVSRRMYVRAVHVGRQGAFRFRDSAVGGIPGRRTLGSEPVVHRALCIVIIVLDALNTGPQRISRAQDMKGILIDIRRNV